MCNVKFTKKEKELLINWLSDDLDIQIGKNFLKAKNSMLIKLLKSIIKKLKTTKRI